VDKWLARDLILKILKLPLPRLLTPERSDGGQAGNFIRQFYSLAPQMRGTVPAHKTERF